MRTNLASDTLLLLGGAAAGAVAMYLLDPDQGTDRRSQIANRAGDAAAGANDSIHAKVDDARGLLGKIADSARKWSHQAADHLASAATQTSNQAHSVLGSTVSDLADSVHTLLGHAKDFTDQAQGHADSARQDLTDRANSLYGRAKSSALRRADLQEAHPYRSAAGHTIGTAGLLAIGAGVMYFADPAKGRARRAWVRDKFFSLERKAGKSASRYGRHLGNKLHGAVAEAKNAVPDQFSDVLDHAAQSAAAVIGHPDGQSGKPM